MSARDWTKVAPDIWRSPRFQKLSEPGAGLLMHYYIAGPHANISGCSCIPDGYVVADFLQFGWKPTDVVKNRQALIDAELVSFDATTGEVFVDRWFTHNPPTNPSHAKGAMKLISKIASDKLRERAEAEFASTDFGAKLMQLTNAANDPLGRGSDRLSNTSFMNGGRAAR